MHHLHQIQYLSKQNSPISQFSPKCFTKCYCVSVLDSSHCNGRLGCVKMVICHGWKTIEILYTQGTWSRALRLFIASAASFFFPDIKLLMFYFYSAIRSLPLLLVAKRLTKGSDWRMMCRLLDTLTLIFSWLMNSFNMGWMTPMRWLEGWLQKRLQKTPMWFKIINAIAILPFTSNHQARKKESHWDAFQFIYLIVYWLDCCGLAFIGNRNLLWFFIDSSEFDYWLQSY